MWFQGLFLATNALGYRCPIILSLLARVQQLKWRDIVK